MKYKFIKYLIVGFVNNLANFLICIISNRLLGINPFYSGSLGYVSGAIISFLLNSKYTFSVYKLRLKNLLLFIISQIFILFIFSLLIYILEKKFQLVELAWLVSTMIVIFLNYFLQLKWVFKNKNNY